MSAVRQEIENLMAGTLVVAQADPLPYFCPDALAGALLEEMEAMWPLISDESKIGLVSIAVSLQHRHRGAVTIAHPAPGLQ